MANKPKKNEALRNVLTHGRNTGNERLLIQDIGSGKILGDVGGTSNQVTLDRSALRKAGSRGARLVHNHPGGGSLSLNDLAKLGRGPADARSVVAISDTGNVYVAKPGKNFKSGLATKQLASKIRERVKADVLADLVVSGKAAATPETAHNIISITNKELERQGVIQYREVKSRNVESVISERQAPKEFGSTAASRAADRDRRIAEAMKKAKSETGGDLRINREPPKPRTPFEAPPKAGGGEGALRDPMKRGAGQRTGGKGKGPKSLDEVTKSAKAAVARKRGVDAAAAADARTSALKAAAEYRAIEKKLIAARKTQRKMQVLEGKLADASKKARAAEAAHAEFKKKSAKPSYISKLDAKTRKQLMGMSRQSLLDELRIASVPTSSLSRASDEVLTMAAKGHRIGGDDKLREVIARGLIEARADAAPQAKRIAEVRKRGGQSVNRAAFGTKKSSAAGDAAYQESIKRYYDGIAAEEAEAKAAKAAKKGPTLKQLRAQAKEAGLKGYSKLKKADLAKAVKDPQGWSDAARKASAKSRNVAQPGKAKTPKAKGRLRSGNAAIMGLIAAGTGVYALTQGASVAEAAEVTADAGTFGGVSNYKRNRASGDSKAVATGKAVAQTGADVATGFALSHYREAKDKGISTPSSMIGAAFRGAATLVSAGLGDLVDMGVKAAFPRTAKMPNTRAASREQKERYARQKMAKRKPAAPTTKRTPTKRTEPDGWVAAHAKRVDGKTVRVDKRRQSNRELRRS